MSASRLRRSSGVGMGASCQSRFTDALVPVPLCERYAIGATPGKGSDAQHLQATASRTGASGDQPTNSLVSGPFEGGRVSGLKKARDQGPAVARNTSAYSK